MHNEVSMPTDGNMPLAACLEPGAQVTVQLNNYMYVQESLKRPPAYGLFQ